MKVIVVGLGVQGHKRRQFAGADYVCSVDPVHPEAEYKTVQEVQAQSFVKCAAPTLEKTGARKKRNKPTK